MRMKQLLRFAGVCLLASAAISAGALADTSLPIADAHVHYSHDSVELTPPERVIELMRNANLKFALVSSSDDNGTQLLSELAPDLIIPGLRPYRRRGETGTWFMDDEALAYVEKLLANNRYASIGEFHLFGSSADLPIPRRIVELAAEYNLVLHAHSDADAVERLLAQNSKVKVLWAHSGFDEPEVVSEMLSKHDRLWADLAFRSEVGRGGALSPEWLKLFTDHPDRMMLGTDTYTPERIYYLPEHAESARIWLDTLPADLAERIAWKNAHDLLMPVWQSNRSKVSAAKTELVAQSKVTRNDCAPTEGNSVYKVSDSPTIYIEPSNSIAVSEQFSAVVTVCGENAASTDFELDATMPSHGHGMNYAPEYTVLAQSSDMIKVQVDGLVLHMPGNWQWQVELGNGDQRNTYSHTFNVQ